MTIAIERPGLVVHQGDALAVLRTLGSESVHCCVCSPPYMGLRSYGTEPVVWDGADGCAHEWGAPHIRAMSGGPAAVSGLLGGKATQEAAHWRTASATCTRCGAWRGELGQEPTVGAFVSHLVEIFRELRRVLRSDGTAWINIGDGYAGTHQTRSASADFGGREAVWRPEDNRPAAAMPAKSLLLVPERLAIALSDDGWIVRSVIIWSKGSCMPESVRDRPTTSHEYVLMLAKSERYYYDQEATREPSTSPEQEAHNRRYARPYAAYDDKAGANRQPGNVNSVGIHSRPGPGGRNARTVWDINSQPFSAARLGVVGTEHYAAFPPDLPRRCIAAGTSDKGVCPNCSAPWARVVERKASENPSWAKGSTFTGGKTGVNGMARVGQGPRYESGVTTGWAPTCACADPRPPVPATVLDPFAGSGTTLATATKMGRSAVGIELNAAYLPIIAARNAQAGMGFFDDEGAAS